MSRDSAIPSAEVEVLEVQRRRRWSAAEKQRLVEETLGPGMSVSLVAREHRVAPSLLFRWRKLASEGALQAVGADELVVPASEIRALRHQRSACSIIVSIRPSARGKCCWHCFKSPVSTAGKIDAVLIEHSSDLMDLRSAALNKQIAHVTQRRQGVYGGVQTRGSQAGARGIDGL